MNRWKTSFAAAIAVLCCGYVTSETQAQVIIGPPVIAPRVVARPVVPVVRPAFVAPSYSAAYVAPAPTVSVGYSSYSTYRPVVSSSVYVAPAPVVAPRVVVAPVVAAPVVRYRPAYVPFQPVRNAIRFGRW